MPIELTIIVKGVDRAYKEKHLCYEDITLTHHDPVLMAYIDQAKLGFKGTPEEIVVKATMSYE